MLRFENVAKPLDAVMVVVPESVPGVGVPPFVPIATVMALLKVVTVLPNPSWAATTIEAIDVPAVVFPGCTVNARTDADPAVMSNAALANVPASPAVVAERV
jgi:hypothetical protein